VELSLRKTSDSIFSPDLLLSLTWYRIMF